MAKAVSSLNILFGATVGPLAGGAAKVGSILDGIKGKAESVGSSLLKWTGVGAAIGALAGGAGIGLLIHEQSEAIDSNAKLSDRLGVSTEALSGLQHAANLSGVSTEALTGGLEKYLKNVAGAAAGNDKLSAAFKSAGLDASKLINLPTDQAIGQIGDALNAITNPAQRAAAATQIFGKSGQGLLPFLAEGSEGIAALTSEADALGLTFSRVDAGKVEEANDAWTRAGSVITGVVRQITIAIAPFLTEASDAFTSAGIKFVSAFKTALPVAVEYVTTGVSWITSTIVAEAQLWWAVVSTAWTAIASVVGPIVTSIYNVVTTNWQAILSTVVGVGVSIFGAVSGLLSGVWSLVSSVAGLLVDAWAGAMDALGVSSLGAGATTASAFTTIGSVASWLADAITTTLTIAGVAFANWQTIVEIAGLNAILSIVTVGNQLEYVFGTVAPAILSWLGENWASIFTDILTFTGVVLTNIGANLFHFLTAIAGWLAGDGFDFQFTGLTDGFESSIKEMPKIAEREIGGLEASLGQQIDGLNTELGDKFSAAFTGNASMSKNVTAGITDTVASAFSSAGELSTGDLFASHGPLTAPIPFDVDTAKADEKLDKTKAKAQDVKNISFGSAEQMQRIALAGIAAPLSVSARSGLGSDGSGKKLDTTNELLGKLVDNTDDMGGDNTDYEEF